MPTSFACPECRTVLKPKADVPAGKKVKCPKCANVFPAPDPAKASAAKPAAPARRPAASAKDDDDDREERRARKGSKKRKQKKQQSNMPMLLIIGGGAGLVVVFLILGLVSPGFLLSQKTKKAAPPAAAQPVAASAETLAKGTGEEDLLNFLPADCNMFAGFDVRQLDQQAGVKQLWQSFIAIQQAAPNTPRKLPEILANVDRMLMGAVIAPGATMNDEPGLNIMRMKTPYQAQAMREMMEANDASEQINGKSCYRLKDNPIMPGRVGVMHMPNDRVLVGVEASREKLEKALTASGEAPLLSAPALAEVRKVDKSCFWMVMMITPAFQQFLANPPPDMPADLKPVAEVLQKVPGVSLKGDMGENGALTLRAAATCASEADGQQLKQGLEQTWEKSGKPGLAGLKVAVNSDVAAALDELVAGMSIKAEGAQVTVEITLGEKSLQTAAAFVQAQSSMVAAMLRGAGPSDPTMQPPANVPGSRPPSQPGGKRPGRSRPGGRPPGG
jgi:DNA-directed RNA polymerase subunit M/transcription elongation factor TFIIS